MGEDIFSKHILPHVAPGSVERRQPYSYPVILQSLSKKAEMFFSSVIFAFTIFKAKDLLMADL